MRWTLALLLLLSCFGCNGQQTAQVVALDDEILSRYVEAYTVIGPAYREAYESGAQPASIPWGDTIQSALGTAGWSWEEYQSVHGSVSTVLLLIEDPDAYRRLEFGNKDAPAANVELVQKWYFEVKKARLIVEEHTWEAP